MKKNIRNLSNDEINLIYSYKEDSSKKGFYLESEKKRFLIPNKIIIIISISYLVLISINSNWNYLNLYLFLFPIIFIPLISEFNSILKIKKLGEPSTFIYNTDIYFVEKFNIYTFKVNEIKEIDIIYSDLDKIHKVRFHFFNEIYLFPIKKENPRLKKFLSDLQELNNGPLNEINERIQKQNKFKKIFDKHKINLLITSNLFFIFLIVQPKIIDYNSFKIARKENTISSYRNYLNEEKNINHRDEAKTQIKSIYNKFIGNYKENYETKESTTALIKTLEFLRDNNKNTIRFEFRGNNQLTDITYNGIEIISIEKNVNKSKNYNREKKVIDILKLNLSNIFPSDLIEINNDKSEQSSPKFIVNYTLQTNPEQLYSKKEDATLPIKEKKYYYGIKANWNFNIYLKKQKDPIYSFQLDSEPFSIFSSETLSAENIYENMIESAFLDLSNKFDSLFFQKKTKK